MAKKDRRERETERVIAATAVADQDAETPEVAPEPEADEVMAAEEEAAMLGRLSPLERAMLAFKLEPRHVLGSRVFDRDGVVGVAITTCGGRRLVWPDDVGKPELSPMEKGDAVPAPPRAGFFAARK